LLSLPSFLINFPFIYQGEKNNSSKRQEKRCHTTVKENLEKEGENDGGKSRLEERKSPGTSST